MNPDSSPASGAPDTGHDHADADRSRLRLLADAGAVFAEEHDPETVLQRLAETTVRTVADAAIVYLTRKDGEIVRLVRVHRDPEQVALLDRLQEVAPLERGDRAVERILDRSETLLLPGERVARWGTTPEHEAAIEELGLARAMFVPMTGQSGAVGIFAAATVEGGRPPLEEEDATVVGELARRAALFVENARYQNQLRRHDARMQAIARASHAFSEASPHLDVLLDRIVHAVCDAVGDYCTLRLLSADGERMELAAIHHPNEEARSALLAMDAEEQPSAREGLFGDVIRTGQPLFLPSVSPEEMRERAPPGIQPYHDRKPVHGLMVVPMAARGRILGTLSTWREHEGAPYSDNDRILLQDLADQAALAVDNARLYQASQSASRSKSQFLSLISHELRTPVNAVLGHADLMELEVGGPLSEEHREAVERIKLNSRKLGRIIDELLMYAGLERDDEELRPEPTALRPVVEEEVDRIAADAAERGLATSIDMPEDVHLSVDANRFRSVLRNLVTNAVRFTREGEVRVEVRRVEDRVVVRVHDTGIGIDPAHLEDVFTPFWQAADAHTRETGGTGLGLSLSRRMARLMGGDIHVESSPGHGSTFELSLPLVQETARDAPPFNERNHPRLSQRDHQGNR